MYVFYLCKCLLRKNGIFAMRVKDVLLGDKRGTFFNVFVFLVFDFVTVFY